MENKYKAKYNQIKTDRRAYKRTEKRSITGDDVIFIFEKVIEGWKTIKIFNTLIQRNPLSLVDKKIVQLVSTGNCKVYPNELSKERYDYYLHLRSMVYDFYKTNINFKNNNLNKSLQNTYMSHTEPVILIFGANGWIGSKVYNLLVDMNKNVFKARSRADDTVSVEKEIQDIGNISQVTHVMSFIGRTHGVYEGETIGTIDYLEKPGKLVENIRDNLFSPVTLAEICKKHNIHFTYLGTGCIFDYDSEHPFGSVDTGFVESDLPNFFGSSYSIVKGYTDRLMHTVYDNSVLNVRIRMPITDEINPRNFITKITNYKKICSIPNSMTVLNELLPILIDMAFKNQVGTINLTNPGLISHNEILEMYKEIIDPDFVWENFTIEDQNSVLASKRSNNCLNTEKLEYLSNVKNIKESVRDILFQMRSNV
jgi:3,5-epimerase/4-reductase